MNPQHTPEPANRRDWADRGATAVELAVAAPIVVLLVFLLTASFHLARATVDVNSAASAATRAASLTRTANAATAAARRTAHRNLRGACTRLHVSVDMSRFRRGGDVTVTVACTITSRALTGVRLPGTFTARAQSKSPIDLHRAATP